MISELHGKIKAGKITAIIGPSGCGKSTLLNMIAGLETARHREIRFSDDESENRPRIGYIFQTPRLMPWLTTRENLELIGGKGNPAITDLLDAMGILDKQNTYCRPFRRDAAQGQHCAGICLSADLLLLDEPFTSLDAPTADQLRQLLLAQWCQQQSTMVFVTHDLREAISLADEIWFLSRSPTSVVHTLAVDQPTERLISSNDGRETINEIASALLVKHPNLLSGETSKTT